MLELRRLIAYAILSLERAFQSSITFKYNKLLTTWGVTLVSWLDVLNRIIHYRKERGGSTNGQVTTPSRLLIMPNTN